MTLTSQRRLGALALAAAVLAGACSSSATPAPTTASPAGSAAPGKSGAAAAPVPPAGKVTLTGTGATFPVPIYDVWNDAFNYKYKNIQIDYKGIGSGGGIKAITEQTVDYGASDAAMTDAALAALPAGSKMLHFPTVLGAVVLIYNLKGVTTLNLDAATVSGIYLGKITKWNDPALAALNSGATLPDLAIKVVRRSDGSGTTNAFTTYLDTVSPEWKASVGKGTEVKWPVGVGAAGNDGVTGAVKGDANNGAIGYVELNYATTAKLSAANLKNAAGKFVAGSTAGVTAAAEGAVSTFPADFRQAPIINGAGDATYPIASYTYLLVYQAQKDQNKAQTVVSYIYWALTEGQGTTGGLGYARLPEQIRTKALEQLHTITVDGKAVWP